MHLEVYIHGMKACSIQRGSVHQLCEALPALAWQQLQPWGEVLSAHCLTRQAAKEPIAALIRRHRVEGMKRYSHLRGVCLQTNQSSTSKPLECVKSLFTKLEEFFRWKQRLPKVW